MSAILGGSILRSADRRATAAVPPTVWRRSRGIGLGFPLAGVYRGSPRLFYGTKYGVRVVLVGGVTAVATPAGTVTKNLHKTGAVTTIATPLHLGTTSSHRTGAASATATPVSVATRNLHETGAVTTVATPSSVAKRNLKKTGAVTTVLTPVSVATRNLHETGAVTTIATAQGTKTMHLHATGTAFAEVYAEAVHDESLLASRQGGRAGGPWSNEGRWPGLRSQLGIWIRRRGHR